MEQGYLIVGVILILFIILTGLPYYLYKTKRIWWEDMLTWLLVEICVLVPVLIVLVILRLD